MTESPAPQWRRPDGRFGPGNPGRPFGSRNRVSRRVVRAILRDFEANQDELLPRLRRWFMPQYVQLVSRLLPRGDDPAGLAPEDLDAAEIAALIAATRTALDRVEAGEASLDEVASALSGDGLDPGAVIIGE